MYRLIDYLLRCLSIKNLLFVVENDTEFDAHVDAALFGTKQPSLVRKATTLLKKSV